MTQLRNWLLVLLIIFITPHAFGEMKFDTFDRTNTFSKPTSSLRNIELLKVVFLTPQIAQQEELFNADKLGSEIAAILETVDIKILKFKNTPSKSSKVPELKIQLEKIAAEKQNNYYRIQTALSRQTELPQSGKLIKADVWTSRPEVCMVSADSNSPAISQTIQQQVMDFATSCIAAAKMTQKSKDGNSINSKKRQKTNTKKPTKDSKQVYSASKNSKIFHYEDCSSAARISQKNLVIYNKRKEAVADKKRPCKICKP